MTSMCTWLHACELFFMAIGYKQVNPTLSQFHFSSGQRASCFASIRSGFFLCLFVSGQAESIWSLWRSVSYQNLMRNQAGEYIPGVFFKKLLPCHRVAKCSANFFPIMLSVCLVNWPQMPSFYKEKYIFSACNVSGKPWIWSHYLFNLLA